MIKCMQKDCENAAAFRYTWPGKNESVICTEHSTALLRVASAIGMHVQLIPLASDISDPMLVE